MIDAAETVRQNVIERTRSGQSSEGGAFAALSTRYAGRKQRAVGRGVADLWFTGELLESLRILGGAGQRFDVRGRGSRVRAADGNTGRFAKFEVSIGFNDPRSVVVGAAHQFGAKGGRLPRRPFLGLSEDDISTTLATIKKGVVSSLESGTKAMERLEVRYF